jgi:cell division protein FtsN
MKVKIILVIALAACAGISCKSKQKLVEIEGADKPAETVIAEETVGNQEITRNESFQFIDGNSTAKKYHVVVGSFKSQDNARRLQKTLKDEGYSSLVAVNEQGMYRVIISSSDTYNEARSTISGIRSRFFDAWVLIQKK